MSYLLRIALPDVPGSLGRVASAIGQAGGDIEAIEIVEKRPDATAVDDVLLEMQPGSMPDSIVSACTALDGVEVLWISRYAAGGNLFLDLEVVEDLTADPEGALDRLIDVLPIAFRCEWAARVGQDGVVRGTEGAPSDLEWVDVRRPARLDPRADDLVAGARLFEDVVLIGRRGGPDFLDSEVARLGHLVALAATIAVSSGADDVTALT